MNIEYLETHNCILFECISGSRAYGLATETSDTDIKGIFVLPKNEFYSLAQPDQLSENNNNRVYFELKKFIDLLSKNNPNMLELLAMPEDCVLKKDKVFDLIKPELFLSRLCCETFAGYAMTQLKKARGLNKKILNPVGEKQRSILEFCYVAEEQGSVPLAEFLAKHDLQQELCGLAAIPHMRDVYGLYYGEEGKYKGIARKEDSRDVSLSSIEKGAKPIALLSFNKDGYSKYCKDYHDYWEWVNNRNEVRYENTIAHGKNYDAKNMMHTFRLLDMAEDIGRSGKIIVRRSNRDHLLKIKKGDFSYEELVKEAEERVKKIEEVYASSSLPPVPDLEKINDLLVGIRKNIYSRD
jgi:hypothetical protein